MINFTKMVATGNDFVVIDNRLQVAPHTCSGSLDEGSRGRLPAGRQECRGTGYRLRELAKRLCNRKTGIGADGLLILQKSEKADFRMRIFNLDGSEPDMCGNGIRCIALYARKKKIAPSAMSIETGAGILYARVGKNQVRINMTEPKGIILSMNLKINGRRYSLHRVNTGVPHIVCFMNNLNNIDLDSLARDIRYHKAFSPEGANVNIVSVRSTSHLSIRTYERGVEAETFACGTGAVASAIISNMVKKIPSPVNVQAQGGKLKIYFKGNAEKGFTDVFLEGEAKEVFTGKINL
jgi:diaminopimelate epimerase